MPIDLPDARVRAPELTGGAMQVLQELKRLERKYAGELVVIGVHSAKLTNEGHTAHIEQTVRRHGIEHPVVNDRDLAIWRACGVRAWPTLLIIDTVGRVVGGVSGEGHEAMMDELSGRVFIADTNHHRIVVAAVDGQITRVIRIGEPGADDGGLAHARFHHPQGLAVVNDVVYVADTGNHLIRSADLESGGGGHARGHRRAGAGSGCHRRRARRRARFALGPDARRR